MLSSFSSVAVSGGAGFLGSHLCERFLELGAQVFCLDNMVTGGRENIRHLRPSPEFHYLDQDVSCGVSVPERVDLVLHFASPASPNDYLRHPLATLRVGSRGTEHMLELARDNGARFVLASTSEVYGEPLEHPQREDYWGNVNPIGPRSVYDESKRYAEALTEAYRREHGVDTAIVRIFNTYGPRMRAGDGRVVPNLITQALRDEPMTITGDGKQTRSFCYVDDLVDGVVRTARSGHHGPINLGSTQELSILELAELVAGTVGTAQRPVFIDRPQDDPSVRRPSLEAASELLGWAPAISVREGIERTVSWFARDPVESPGPLPAAGR